MNVAQTRCHGCKRAFTPRGLSQHAKKTLNARCQLVHSGSQDHLRSRSVTHVTSSLALNSSRTPRINPDDASGNDANNGTPPVSTAWAHELDGEFDMTCVMDAQVHPCMFDANMTYQTIGIVLKTHSMMTFSRPTPETPWMPRRSR